MVDTVLICTKTDKDILRQLDCELDGNRVLDHLTPNSIANPTLPGLSICYDNSGILMGPDHPVFNHRCGEDPINWRPPGIPLGARYDPLGVPDVTIPRPNVGRGGRRHEFGPNPDHLPKPE